VTDSDRALVRRLREQFGVEARERRRGLQPGTRIRPDRDPEIEARIAAVRAWKDATGREGRPGQVTEEVLARILPD
jgi:hypothetical protein